MTADQVSSPANRSFGKLVLLAIGWQWLPTAWLMWDSWDSASTTTLVLRFLVFLVVPFFAGVTHKSWQVGLAAICAPIFAIGVMTTVSMLIMPIGKW